MTKTNRAVHAVARAFLTRLEGRSRGASGRLFQPGPPRDAKLSEVAACAAVVMTALWIDVREGIQFSPMLPYLAVAVYVAWKWPVRQAATCISLVMVLMVAADISDLQFFQKPMAEVQLGSRLVSLALICGALSRFRDASLRLIEEKKARLASYGMFVATISHEFRTPLTVIDGHAQQLAGMATAPPNVRERSAKIRAAALRIHRLVDRILLCERIEHRQLLFRPEPLNLPALIGACCEAHAQANGEVTISHRLDRLPVVVDADPVLIEQVFDNLLANAILYSDPPARIEVDGHADEGHVVVTMRDFGVGISPEDIERVFERYFRGHNANRVSGTGIGLYLVKSILHQHGGSVTVDSMPGNGTTFTVRWPIRAVENPTIDEGSCSRGCSASKTTPTPGNSWLTP